MSSLAMLVTIVALVAITAPVLYLTWHSMQADEHTPANHRRRRDAD